MIKCPFCLAVQVQNTIFCNECGYCFLEDESPETDPLEGSDIGWIKGNGAGITEEPPIQAGSWPVTLRLVIGEGKRIVEVPLDRSIYLGRLDPASNVFPEVDLSSDTAVAKGVSRRHARILKQGDVVMVEDLGSINGTFVNSRRLAPYLPETLRNGDILQLGKLQLEVRLQK